jgi:hypothetical protein
MSNLVKILFEIEPDQDGYPPLTVESVWATVESEGRYKLDNIPFFARKATLDDVVAVSEDDGDLWFSAVVGTSGNSLLRVVLFDETRIEELRQHLGNLGCSTEWDKTHDLVSVNVPMSARLGSVQEYLRNEAAKGWLDYEEPLLRQ